MMLVLFTRFVLLFWIKIKQQQKNIIRQKEDVICCHLRFMKPKYYLFWISGYGFVLSAHSEAAFMLEIRHFIQFLNRKQNPAIFILAVLLNSEAFIYRCVTKKKKIKSGALLGFCRTQTGSCWGIVHVLWQINTDLFSVIAFILWWSIYFPMGVVTTEMNVPFRQFSKCFNEHENDISHILRPSKSLHPS